MLYLLQVKKKFESSYSEFYVCQGPKKKRYCPDKYKKPIPNLNEELLDLKGELPDRQAKITLAKFMRSNLGFTTELMSGIKLALYQEITLKAFFNRNFSIMSHVRR